MNKILKKILIIVLCVVVAVGAVFGGLTALNATRRKPVDVYQVQDFAMTEYWGDTSESYGIVTTDNLQNVYLSETQKVVEVFVEEGQKVSVGDPLLRFDTTLSDIALERAQNNVEKMKLSLEDAKKELEVISRMVPHYTVLVTPENKPSTTVPMETPAYLGGEGTLEQPHTFLWGEEDVFSADFLNAFYAIALQKRQEQEALNPTEPSEPVQSEELPPEETESPENPEEKPEEPEKEKGFYLCFMIRQENKTDGIIQNVFGLYLMEQDGKIVFRPYSAMVPQQWQYEYVPQEPYYEEYGSMYTAAEIARMRSEKEKEIADLDISLKTAEVELRQMEDEVNNGIVLSKVDGYVQNLISEDEAMMMGMPLMRVTDGGGYFITVSLSELEMSSVHIGQSVSVSSWETGTYCEGVIQEISTFPAPDNGNYRGEGNTNVTYYPFVVYVDGTNTLREGSYVSVSYEAAEENVGGFYLEKPFVRTENGRSYVFVRNSAGVLEERTVKTGKNLWGSYVQVLDGITVNDFIAFPYGRDVKNGAKTNQATVNDFYAMY